MLGAELGWNTVDFGPGPNNTAHQVIECVKVSDLVSTTKVYLEVFKLLEKENE